MAAEWVFPKLYPIFDSALLVARSSSLLEAVRAAIHSGVGILQIRHKADWSRAAFAEAEEAARLCHESGVLPVVNDRADIAALLGAGVHVGQDDLPPAAARRLIGPNKLLGFSTHNEDQVTAAASEPVNYIAMGPVFATTSKANPDPAVGPEGVRQWRGRVQQPVIAIGGITRSNAREVLDAGAASLAVINDLLPDPCTESNLRKRIEEWLELVNR